MRHDKEGRPLYKRVKITVELPGQRPKVHQWVAAPGQGWNEAGIDEILDRVCAHVEQKYPFIAHRLVSFMPNEHKLVFVEYNVAPTPN